MDDTVITPLVWDVFVSHASEDKDLVVHPLARALSQRGLRVWLDDFELRAGDSLREKLDYGLARSRYGIVVLSESFFAKHWTQLELGGLLARETRGRKVLLPLRHGLDQDRLAVYSPLLAARVSVTTENGIEAAADSLLKAISAEPERIHVHALAHSISEGEIAIELRSRSLLWPVPRGYVVLEGVPTQIGQTSIDVHYASVFDPITVGSIRYQASFNWRTPDQFAAALSRLRLPFGDYSYAGKALRFAVDLCHARIRCYDDDALRMASTGERVPFAYTGRVFCDVGRHRLSRPRSTDAQSQLTLGRLRDLGASAGALAQDVPDYFDTPDWHDEAEELQAEILEALGTLADRTDLRGERRKLEELSVSASHGDTLRDWLRHASEVLEAATKWYPRTIRK